MSDRLVDISIIALVLLLLVMLVFISTYTVNEVFGEELEYKDKCIDKNGGKFVDEYCDYTVKCFAPLGTLLNKECSRTVKK